MSKIFLASNGRRGRAIRILEATPDVAKDTVIRIRAKDPKSSVAVFAAKDIETLKRTQPTLAVAKVTRSVDEFIGKVTRTVAKMTPGAKLRTVTYGKSHKGKGAIAHGVRKSQQKSTRFN